MRKRSKRELRSDVMAISEIVDECHLKVKNIRTVELDPEWQCVCMCACTRDQALEKGSVIDEKGRKEDNFLYG